ncbi:hypothetical protein H0H93_000599 [Arthromyces matolae]|nr:hypothetical protein H0H93_000599 [Arthromyces matolae]
MDFNHPSSGWSTPRRVPAYHVEPSQTDFATMWARKTERSSGSRTEARTFEERVARVAQKKCSVEEVALLYKELDEWLKSDSSDQTSLLLSSALLRAILMNHQAHSDSSRNMKIAEANLNARIDELKLNNEKIETELRKYRQQYTAKAMEYQTVCGELNKLKASLGIPVDVRQSATSPTPPTSPTPYTSASSQSPSISRFNSLHQRSTSMSSRPTTPATPSPSRTYTPAPTPTPLLRTQTPAPPLPRTQTPMVRPFTPAVSAVHTLRSMTQTPSPMRNMSTPAPPPIPTKPRRLSTPAPPKMMRSTSEEKGEIHQIWLPPGSPDPPLRAPSRSATRTPYTTASSRYAPSLTR